MTTTTPRSVRRLRSFFIDPISCFVWLAFIPFGCLWFAYGIVQSANAVLDWLFA